MTPERSATTLRATTALAVVLPAGAVFAAERGIGFRGDVWRGIFPEDCKPPTEFGHGDARWRSWYGWHEAYAAPFASGNRLFVRTFDNLYCFADRREPFTPSKAFEPTVKP